MTDSAHNAEPLSREEIAKEREWVEAPGLAAGVFDKSTVVSIERRFLATIDDRDKTIADLRSLLQRLEELCDDAFPVEVEHERPGAGPLGDTGYVEETLYVLKADDVRKLAREAQAGDKEEA